MTLLKKACPCLYVELPARLQNMSLVFGTNSDKIRTVWTCLDPFEQLWQARNKSDKQLDLHFWFNNDSV